MVLSKSYLYQDVWYHSVLQKSHGNVEVAISASVGRRVIFRMPRSHLTRKGTQAAVQEHQLIDYWYLDLVKEYTRAQLTHESDRFPALSAIAKQFCAVLKDESCLAGLWKDHPLMGLMWRCFGRFVFADDLRGMPITIGY